MSSNLEAANYLRVRPWLPGRSLTPEPYLIPSSQAMTKERSASELAWDEMASVALSQSLKVLEGVG